MFLDVKFHLFFLSFFLSDVAFSFTTCAVVRVCMCARVRVCAIVRERQSAVQFHVHCVRNISLTSARSVLNFKAFKLVPNGAIHRQLEGRTMSENRAVKREVLTHFDF